MKEVLKNMKKILSLVLCLCMLLTALPLAAMAEDYKEPITLNVFSEVANFGGEQKGWFAKEVKDRFNITLNFISSNVDSNAYSAGVAAGSLGDIICLGDMGEHFTTALKADLLMDLSDIDMTQYPTLNTYFTKAFDKVSNFAAEQGVEGKYGFAFSVAMEDNAWSEITDPTYGLQVRFDAWEKAGKPSLTSLEDLPAFLKAMQDAGAYLLEDPDKIQKLREVVFPDCEHISRDVVGRSPQVVGKMIGIDVPANCKTLLCKYTGCAHDDVLSKEILFPLARYVTYTDFKATVAVAVANLEQEGAGHNSCIWTHDEEKIEYAAHLLPVSRFQVNQTPAGINNGLPSTPTLGCGTWGNNSISENLNYTHLINVSQIGLYNKDAKIPTDEEIWN